MGSDRGKTALILTGGGMRSAHGAGFLYCLGAELGITAPDILIGTSGNAGNALYFAAGQYDYLRSIWTEYDTWAPDFISFRRLRHIMDVDYLIDEVFKKRLPLDVAALEKTKSICLIPTTNAKTGKTQYWRSGLVDPFELLRAAKAIPYLYGKKITLKGRRYIDGEIGPTLSDHIREARRRGATSIVVVDDHRHAGRLVQYALHLYGLFSSPGLRRAISHDLASLTPCQEAGATLCVTADRLPAHVTTRNKEKLQLSFGAGISDAMRYRKELISLLG